MKLNKIIGVLGGMGPQASAEFYSLLISKSCQQFKIKQNNEFPEILLDSVPVPDFISDAGDKDMARDMLVDRVKRLSSYPVTSLCIACNTAHLLLPELQKVTQVPFISIIDEVRNVVLKNNYKRVGLFASITTYKTGLYSHAIPEVVVPENKDQLLLEQAIRSVIAGTDRDKVQKSITPLVQEFIKKTQVDAVILGCTEIPLIFPKEIDVPIIDSLKVLADAVLHHYFQQK